MSQTNQVNLYYRKINYSLMKKLGGHGLGLVKMDVV